MRKVYFSKKPEKIIKKNSHILHRLYHESLINKLNEVFNCECKLYECSNKVKFSDLKKLFRMYDVDRYLTDCLFIENKNLNPDLENKIIYIIFHNTDELRSLLKNERNFVNENWPVAAEREKTIRDIDFACSLSYGLVNNLNNFKEICLKYNVVCFHIKETEGFEIVKNIKSKYYFYKGEERKIPGEYRVNYSKCTFYKVGNRLSGVRVKEFHPNCDDQGWFCLGKMENRIVTVSLIDDILDSMETWNLDNCFKTPTWVIDQTMGV